MKCTCPLKLHSIVYDIPQEKWVVDLDQVSSKIERNNCDPGQKTCWTECWPPPRGCQRECECNVPIEEVPTDEVLPTNKVPTDDVMPTDDVPTDEVMPTDEVTEKITVSETFVVVENTCDPSPICETYCDSQFICSQKCVPQKCDEVAHQRTYSQTVVNQHTWGNVFKKGVTYAKDFSVTFAAYGMSAGLEISAEYTQSIEVTHSEENTLSYRHTCIAKPMTRVTCTTELYKGYVKTDYKIAWIGGPSIPTDSRVQYTRGTYIGQVWAYETITKTEKL